MSLLMIQDFLFWCVIINTGLLCLSFIMIAMMRNIICKMHGKIFKMPEDSLYITLYKLLGTYKILIIFFNIVPLIATYIID